MDKIVILYNPVKEKALNKAESLAKSLEEKNFQVKIAETKQTTDDWGVLDSDTKLAVVLGGDGSFLISSKQTYKYDVPLLGVNFGHLGFLSEFGDISMNDLASSIAEKNYIVESRTFIKAEIFGEDKALYALNDIAVNRSLSSNLLSTDLYIDNNLLHSFRSDGIVICTPTGSTAYALSAGGAVMDPNIHAFQIVPIAAHSLNSRPHVVSDSQEIVLESKDNNLSFYIQADGHQPQELAPGTKIKISKAEHDLKLATIKNPDRNFYSILRDKMKWGAIAN